AGPYLPRDVEVVERVAGRHVAGHGEQHGRRVDERRDRDRDALVRDLQARFSTWEKSSSTGVARPKIETFTLSFCLSGFTSSTVPEKFANAPSMTRISSPTSKFTRGFGLTAPSTVRRRWSSISCGRTSCGRWLPMKPVTFGVSFTRCHASSLISLSTKMYPGRLVFWRMRCFPLPRLS